MLTLDTPSVYRLLELVSTGLVDDRLLIPWCDRMIEQHAEVPYWVLECAMTHDPDEIQRQLWEHLRDHHSPYAFRGEEDREAYQLDCVVLQSESEFRGPADKHLPRGSHESIEEQAPNVLQPRAEGGDPA